MTVSLHQRSFQLRPRAAALTLIPALLLLVTVASSAQAAAVAVPLGTAGSFAILAGSGITNTGTTTVNGDIGTFPTPSITGRSSMVLTGVNHAGDAVTQQAKSDLVNAYGNAAGQGPRNAIKADLGGKTLSPGVYNSASAVGLTGTLTLNAHGNPHAAFVFQAGSTLITASASRVVLINGASPCNVFWQVGSSATLGTGSTFLGTILAYTSITVTNRVTILGRVLARNGAVTLDTDTISRPNCAGGTPPPATTTTTRNTTTTSRTGGTTTTSPNGGTATTSPNGGTATTSPNGGGPRTPTTMPRTGTTIPGTGSSVPDTGTSRIPNDVPPPPPGTPKHSFGFTA